MSEAGTPHAGGGTPAQGRRFSRSRQPDARTHQRVLRAHQPGSAPIDELRAIARVEVEKARKSNQNIIFGYGHSSVAEHASFNIDVIGVSRYAVEEIQKFRLLAYTEKSQRYILLEDDFVIPEEIKNAGLKNLFVRTIKAQNACYHALYEKLRPWVFDQNPELAAKEKKPQDARGLGQGRRALHRFFRHGITNRHDAQREELGARHLPLRLASSRGNQGIRAPSV